MILAKKNSRLGLAQNLKNISIENHNMLKVSIVKNGAVSPKTSTGATSILPNFCGFPEKFFAPKSFNKIYLVFS